jgi:hypothetical protein
MEGGQELLATEREELIEQLTHLRLITVGEDHMMRLDYQKLADFILEKFEPKPVNMESDSSIVATPPHNTEELEKAIILPLMDYVALSCINFRDFHGQEEGDDPELDKNLKREREAKKTLLKSIIGFVVDKNLHELCWATKPLTYTSCDRKKSHSGLHSWENNGQ